MSEQPDPGIGGGYLTEAGLAAPTRWMVCLPDGGYVICDERSAAMDLGEELHGIVVPLRPRAAA